jgi:hypothetical protein
MYDAINTLGMADLVMERESAQDQKAYLMEYGFHNIINMEGVHRMWHMVMKKMQVTRYNATSLLVADSSDSALQRWSVPQLMKYHGIYFGFKYIDEYTDMKDRGVF